MTPDKIREAVERLSLLLADMERLDQKVLGFDGNGLHREDLSALLSLVREVLPRPIEEAPKDGTPILARWADEPFDPSPMYFDTSLNGFVWLNEGGGVTVPGKQPTHWYSKDALPLPQEGPHG